MGLGWIGELFRSETVTQAVLVLSLISAIGVMIGSIRIFGISIGIAGVLFSGIVFGHFGISINSQVSEFVREFGLVLFVYTIGVQVGPGFFSSLRSQGLPLNLMALAIVVIGVSLAIILHHVGGVDPTVVVGLFAGATTNTPSLGAAQQALKEVQGISPDALRLPGLAYAVAYPCGILGVILTLSLLRAAFRVKLGDEIDEIERSVRRPQLKTMNIVVENANLDGIELRKIPGLNRSGIVISRLLHQGTVAVAHPHSVLRINDILLAIGLSDELEELRITIGSESPVNVRDIPSNITRKRFVITSPAVVGRTLQDLDLATKYGVTLSRVSRAEVEFTPTENYHFQFGDHVLAVGEAQGIQKAEHELGNSIKVLEKPQMIPVFVGIALGALVGSWPVSLPGTPVALKLGLAGGPLIVAILLSRLGHVGKLVWYMPTSANLMLRELGILMFLSTVGLRAGDKFLAILTQGPGLQWMAYGALITLVPIVVVGSVARIVLKMNYLTISGLLAGSMTDPPALAFANAMSGSEKPAISYATVYPLTMLLRVVAAQLLVFFLT